VEFGEFFHGLPPATMLGLMGGVIWVPARSSILSRRISPEWQFPMRSPVRPYVAALWVFSLGKRFAGSNRQAKTFLGSCSCSIFSRLF